MNKVLIFTDGACSGNPGPGGWGSILKYQDHIKELSGGEAETTNNRMELTAVIKALESLTRKCDIIITTDSNYVKNGITQWIKKWEKNNWKTASKTPVKNKELWVELNTLSKKHNIKWKWVKGHSGHAENERCDELARREITKIKKY